MLKPSLVKNGNEGSEFCWEFYAVSPTDMRRLGAAFGEAVLPHVPAAGSILNINLILYADLEKLRVGLCSDDIPELGKSTFTDGLLSTVNQKKALESRAGQHLWHSPETGWIRHYDCKIWDTKLPSYRKNNFSKCATPLIDIVEHPYHDKHNRNFDCLAYFEHCGKSVRRVTIKTTPEFAQTPAFRRFLELAQPLMKKPKSIAANTDAKYPIDTQPSSPPAPV